MSSYISIVLKGTEFKVRHTFKIETQRELNMLNIEMAKRKAELMELGYKRKQLMVELLDDRQMIIYKNGYNKNLPHAELQHDRRYLKQRELLKAYDDVHGTYIPPN
jgi:CRISPR/Cas system CSM-associated protein Csm3 (group 7 of RAMP superfamily)